MIIKDKCLLFFDLIFPILYIYVVVLGLLQRRQWLQPLQTDLCYVNKIPEKFLHLKTLHHKFCIDYLIDDTIYQHHLLFCMTLTSQNTPSINLQIHLINHQTIHSSLDFSSKFEHYKYKKFKLNLKQINYFFNYVIKIKKIL